MSTPAYLSDDVTVGELLRWINAEHVKAAKETPQNMDSMRALQRWGDAVEIALSLFRNADCGVAFESQPAETVIKP